MPAYRGKAMGGPRGKVQAKETSLERNQHCLDLSTLILGFQIVRNKFCCLSHPVWVF